MLYVQTLGFKTVSLLELPRLEPAGSAVVRGYVTARHNAVLERCAAMEAELAELKALVRDALRCAVLWSKYFLLILFSHKHMHCQPCLVQLNMQHAPLCSRPAIAIMCASCNIHGLLCRAVLCRVQVRQRCPNLLLQASLSNKTATHHSGAGQTLA